MFTLERKKTHPVSYNHLVLSNFQYPELRKTSEHTNCFSVMNEQELY